MIYENSCSTGRMTSSDSVELIDAKLFVGDLYIIQRWDYGQEISGA